MRLFVCDCCGREVDSSKELSALYTSELFSMTVDPKSIAELCGPCLENAKRVITSHKSRREGTKFGRQVDGL